MISFIIRTLNEEDSVGQVIDRIHKLEDDYDKEIIIVDSGSTDDTIRIAKDKGCKVINIRKEDFTWGRSLNLGIANAKYNYIINISAHCFVTDKKFAYNAVNFINSYNLAAGYGIQIGLPYVDPLEEIELAEWFPRIPTYIMDNKMLEEGKNIGISNACCILRRDVWEKIRFDETVQSLEDFLWAVKVTNDGYSIGYSDTFGVYHSHKYSVDNIYKRWYARTYESLKYQETYNRYDKLKHFVKKHLYAQYLFITRSRRVASKYKLLDKKYDHFIKFKVLYAYQQIIDAALIEATKAYFEKSNIIYKKITCPSKLGKKVGRLNVIESKLVKVNKSLMNFSSF